MSAGLLDLACYLLLAAVSGDQPIEVLRVLPSLLALVVLITALASGIGVLTGLLAGTRPRLCIPIGISLSAVCVGSALFVAVAAGRIIAVVVTGGIGLAVAAVTAHRLGRRLAAG